MADINKLIPFILEYEAGVIRKAGESLPQLFERARFRGFSNDPLDRGGATMVGVTLSSFRNYRKRHGNQSSSVEDLKTISFDEWRAILKEMYWDRWQADNIHSQPIANILVDWVWASGVHGIKEPQKILGVAADGIVGSRTLSALNGHRNQQGLFEKIREARIRFVEDIVSRNPSQGKWLKGWLRRINAIVWSFIILLAMTCGGCTKTVYVPTEHIIHKSDTVFAAKSRTDSIIDRDTVTILVRGDSVTTDRIKWRIRIKELHDTVRLTRIDSAYIEKPYPVEVIKEVAAPTSWCRKTLQYTGFFALLLIAATIYKKIRRSL